MKNKKIYLDMVLNIGAAGMPIVVLQLIVYPLLSRQLETSIYSVMITLYSLVILVNDSLGRSINNIRLVRNNEEEAREGDYNVICVIYIVVGLFATVVGIVFYSREAPVTSMQGLFLSFTSILFLANAYLNVYYRIRLNFVAIFINSFCMSMGLLAGFLGYRLSGNWALIFFFCQFFGLVYILKTTTLAKEPMKRTKHFRPILIDSSLLAASMFLSQGMIQADKLLLLPMLGAETLAFYYTASLAGKVVSLAMGPVNGVILSYVAGKEQLSKGVFKKYFLLCLLACAVISIVMLAISRPVLSFLFPKFVDGAMRLIPFTTLNVFLYTMAGMMTPLVMRYCDIYWQIVINGVGVALYVVLAVVLLQAFGVIGFCLGIGISHFSRLALMIWIYNKREVSDKPDN